MLDLQLLPESLRDSTGRWWEQFEQNLVEQKQARDASEALKQALGGQLPAPDFAGQLARAFGGSEYLAKSCAADPELLLDLLSSGALLQPLPEAGYTELRAAVERCTSEAELDRTLRRQRRKAMVRIIWRDLNRLATMPETTADLSALAEASIALAAGYHYRQLADQWGTPTGEGSGLAQPFLVLGMGKLGAAELNLSSDVDLIFAYPESGETTGGAKTSTNQEFFVRLGQKVIKSLDAVTVDGFVFRVDMRLRPYGQDGALASNFDSLEDYYQSQGRDWERYAMVKARVVATAGGEQAARYSDQLMNLLRPFTYRQYIDFSVIESLREMKDMISRQVKRRGMDQDVKLGEGGIRELEFVVQVFQLIRGGRDPRLRERQVCKLLPLLEQEGYLPAGSGERLLAAYHFLRNTEHAIQAWQDRQTQALPTDTRGRERLAWAMGYGDWAAFAEALADHRQAVSQAFGDVIADPEAEQSRDDGQLVVWRSLWEGSTDGEEALTLLAGHGSEDPERSLRLLQGLADGRPVAAMQASSRARLDAFMPRLLAMLSEEFRAGQLPTGGDETLARVLPLVEATVRRSAYLVLLVENPTALRHLVRLCAASPMIADELARFPALLDELLTPESLYAPPDREALRDELRRDALGLAWDDLEGHMEALRYFRLAHGLRVAASEVTGALPLMKVSDYLTYLAEVILEHVLALAWEQMTARHGYPRRGDGESERTPNLVVVGYGKLGGIELGHGSDLDLVFIHNADGGQSTDGERPLDNLTFYTRLGQRIIHILETRMASGKLYEVDMRLRPSGASGLLVSSLAGFAKYQKEDAWTWEHQALVRARVVAGSEQLAGEFAQLRREVLCRKRDLAALRLDVVQMRKKMRDHLGSRPDNGKNGGERAAEDRPFNLKQDAGGIVDIEFMVQYAVLAWAAQEPALTEYTDNIRILESLSRAGLLAETSVGQLIDVYKAYRSTGHRLALQRQEAVLQSDAPFAAERKLVIDLWQQLLETDA